MSTAAFKRKQKAFIQGEKVKEWSIEVEAKALARLLEHTDLTVDLNFQQSSL